MIELRVQDKHLIEFTRKNHDPNYSCSWKVSEAGSFYPNEMKCLYSTSKNRNDSRTEREKCGMSTKRAVTFSAIGMEGWKEMKGINHISVLFPATDLDRAD